MKTYLPKKTIYLLFTISMSLLFFRVPISIFLDTFFVGPIFSHFEKGTVTETIFILTIIYLGYKVVKKVPRLQFLKAACYFLVFYLFERLNGYWKFEDLILVPWLGYWDFVAIAIVAIGVASMFFQWGDDSSKHLQHSNGFLPDAEVITMEDDHFKRKISAGKIAELIGATNHHKSFAIGILGEYGSGKSSFLNLVGLQLEEKKFLTIPFNPWSASSVESIRKEFFDLLSMKVAAIDPQISALIYSYGRSLSDLDDRSKSWVKWLGFLVNDQRSLSSDEYGDIEKLLKRCKRKIVIIIDDLDRLYPNEIMEVLKLVRNTANFPNIFYLVAYDKSYIQRALKSLNEYSEYDFLDKIFQMEVPLPKWEPDDLLTSLSIKLKEIVSGEHYLIFENTIIPSGFRNLYEKAYGDVLRQGRDVIRFANSFKLGYSLVGEEVDFESLLILELIKFRYPVVYDLIYINSEKLLYKRSVRSSHEEYYMPITEKDGKEDKLVFKSFLEKQDSLRENDIELLVNLFKMLFKGNEYHRPEAKNSISYPMYYEIYFRYRISSRDISDKEYGKALSSNKMGQFMAYCVNLNLHKELMMRFMQEDISKSRQHFETILGFIFSFGRTVVQKEGRMSFDYQSLIDKIYNYHNHITDTLYKKDKDAYRNFIISLFDRALAPFLFENELIYHLKNMRSEFILTNDDLVAYQLSFFRRMADSGHGLSEDTTWLFWGARQNYTKEDPIDGKTKGYWRFEPSIASLLKFYMKKNDPTEFLKTSIERNFREPDQIFIHHVFLEIFEDKNELRKIVEKNILIDDLVKKEYIELFDKCAAKGFSEYVEMDFKSELKKAEP